MVQINRVDPRKSLFKKSVELGEGAIRGYDFEKEFDAGKFFESFKDTGFQATNLASAIRLVKEMRKQKATIFLGFTSNITSSGLRDIITYLVRNRLVHFLVTTTGGLEEDIIKTHGDFLTAPSMRTAQPSGRRASTGPGTYSYRTRGTYGLSGT